MIIYISVVLAVMSPLSFMILFEFFFFLLSLAKGLCILFLKTKLLVSLIFLFHLFLL